MNNADEQAHDAPSLPDPTVLSTGDPVSAMQRPKPHRTLSGMTYTHTGVGAEPGINPRRNSAFAEFGHIKQASQIEVIDYSNEKSTSCVYNNAEFCEMLNDKERFTRDPTTTVRWINIGGLSWDVLSAVALKYEIHSLALEDVLQEQGHNHSKADYYPNHLFLRILCHSLANDIDDNESDASSILSTSVLIDAVPFPRSSSPIPLSQSLPSDIEYEEPVNEESKHSRFEFLRKRHWRNVKDVEDRRLPYFSRHEFKQRLTGLTGFRTAARQRRLMKLQALKQGDRVNVKVAPMYIFLFRDGTVITLHPTPNLDFTQPITTRLHQDESVLRTSNDASLLVESILDLVVDRVLEIIDAYQDKIHEIENEILLKPTMSTVRSLHILSGDLILHKRTLDPIKSVIYGLRRYDLDRCIAIADMTTGSLRPHATLPPRSTSPYSPTHSTPTMSRRSSDESGDSNHSNHSDTHTPSIPEGLPGRTQGHHENLHRDGRPVHVEGYMSYKAKIYLADVYDHMDFVLTSLDMFAGISENLINYAFNMASYEMNETMRRLTVATIIFLPLTLLTGYFGMNFDHMWSIQHGHSDLVFWIICLPMMGLLLPIFLYQDIARMVHYLKKKMAGERLIKRKL